MAEVVLKVPVQLGEEAQLFGSFFNRFMENRSLEAEQMASFADAPYLMMRSDPADGHEVKVLTFQEHRVASDFSSGWAEARTGRAMIRRA